jgi:hypothetical protein
MSKSLIALLLVPLGLIPGQELKPVALPTPQTSGGKPLMQVLKERKSVRDFGPEQLSRQMLSNLLWAAWGINREDGRRTAPSASNRQEIDVYAIMADGAYLYDAKANALKPVEPKRTPPMHPLIWFTSPTPPSWAATTRQGWLPRMPTPGSSHRTCISSALPKVWARWCVDR